MTNQIAFPAQWKFWETFSTDIEAIAQEDREAAKELLFAMYEYASWGREPEFPAEYKAKHLDWAFNPMRINLDNSVKACTNGKLGGKKKAANAKKKQKEEAPEIDPNELKRAKRATRAMGSLYQTVVQDDDFSIPDDVLEEQAGWAEDLSEAFAREAMLG